MSDLPGSEVRLRDLRLAMAWQIPPRWLRLLRQRAASQPSGGDALDEGSADLSSCLPPGLQSAMARFPSAAEARSMAGRLQGLGARFLVCEDAAFPAALREIPDPPPYLFVRGDPLEDPDAPCVAIVGSRAASAAGKEIARSLARDLALSGCVVVSGLARGIDAEAHRGALEAGGRTIAVLGTGVDRCYPPEHEELLEAVLERGGIVSEFPPGTSPLKLHFPRRNRILTGLSRALIVVEGGKRSGARSSVDHALDQGREVLAVPRDILHPGSALPNHLIRDGARPVLGIRDVLDVVAPGHICSVTSGAHSLDQRILSELRDGCKAPDTLARRIPEIPIGSLQAALLRLEVLGVVLRGTGGRYRAAHAPARQGGAAT